MIRPNESTMSGGGIETYMTGDIEFKIHIHEEKTKNGIPLMTA